MQIFKKFQVKMSGHTQSTDQVNIQLSGKKDRHPIDDDFLDMMNKIKTLSEKIIAHDSKIVKKWLVKLTGTNPVKRNEYARYLLQQLTESGKLEMPFAEIPGHFIELPPLHEALHGPIPDVNAPKTTKWRSTRSKIEVSKQMSQTELKSKYGTDRLGLHISLRDVKNIDDFTVQKLVAIAGPYTKDGGAALVQIMQEELQSFRTDVKSFYDWHSAEMAQLIGKEQLEMKNAFKNEVSALTKKVQELEVNLKKKNPNLDFNWFRNYIKVDAEQKKKLKRLMQKSLKQEKENKKIRDLIADLEEKSPATS